MKLDPTTIIAIVITVLHVIPWALAKLKLTRAAALFAHYTPTINALLPRAALVVADVVEAPKGERGAVAIEDLSKMADASGNGEAAILLARVAKMLGIGAVLAMVGCSGGLPTGSQVQTGVTAVEDVGSAVCAVLQLIPQTDTTETQFICSELPKPGAVASPKTFLVHVPKADAPRFAADHCVQAGSGKPTP